MRILVIEDETRIATFIQRGLEEEGYAVDVAYDGRDGLKRACEDEYDLLVLEVENVSTAACEEDKAVVPELLENLPALLAHVSVPGEPLL